MSFSLDARETLLKSLKPDSQPPVVDAQLMQNRTVEVTDVDRVFNDVVAEVVALAVNNSALYAPPAIQIVKQRG